MTLGEIIAVDFPEVDLAQIDMVRDLIQFVKPSIIINAAAYTNVDKAESEPELARKVNSLAPAVMAEEIKKLQGAFIHYSTDYVFDGSKGSPYTENDSPNPLNVYGASKLEGDQLVQGLFPSSIIFRLCWVYGLRQGGFLTKVLQWSRQHEVLKIVNDQIATPTWARQLAEVTAQLIARGKDDPIGFLTINRGLYHLAGKGFTSRYEWAKAIINLDPLRNEQIVKEIVPVSSSEYSTPAQRPAFSALNCKKFLESSEFYLPEWEIALSLAMHYDSNCHK